MKIKLKIEKEFDARFIDVKAKVRYWEDATVNGQEDSEGTLIPFRIDDNWCPKISIDHGTIINWPQGTVAEIHYKICDEGVYTLLDESGEPITAKEGYVPDIMCPDEPGYGDYIIMKVDSDGKIADWKPTLSGFEHEDF